GLYHRGKCSSCGPGNSIEARAKIAFQEELGFRCPVLACAIAREIDYCSRDCPAFPCSRFEQGPYPLSHNFIRMYRRRSCPGH
ncbi:MAG: DUF3795 domain-containing protein, partial [Thermoanaerobacteraceae bacterium]|nr:DUF3795 domain-containing protein [Thermoanaerobacteraceae bacterium]